MTAVVNGQLFRGVLFAPVSKPFLETNYSTHALHVFDVFPISGTWSDSSETGSAPPNPLELGRAPPAAATAGSRHPGPPPAGATGDGLRAARLRPPRAARVPGEGRQVRTRARQQRPARRCAHAARAWRGQVSPLPESSPEELKIQA